MSKASVVVYEGLNSLGFMACHDVKESELNCEEVVFALFHPLKTEWEYKQVTPHIADIMHRYEKKHVSEIMSDFLSEYNSFMELLPSHFTDVKMRSLNESNDKWNEYYENEYKDDSILIHVTTFMTQLHNAVVELEMKNV